MILKDESVEHHYEDEDIWDTHRGDTNQFSTFSPIQSRKPVRR